MEKLFIYGTLQDVKVQREIIGRTMEGMVNKLFGYALSEIEVENERYPLLVPQEGSVVSGQVITVTDDELRAIDAYETDTYKRKRVVLESGEEAWVYLN